MEIITLTHVLVSLLLLLLPLQLFTAPWTSSRTIWMSWYQKGKTRKGKTNLDLLEQEIVSGSGISYAI